MRRFLLVLSSLTILATSCGPVSGDDSAASHSNTPTQGVFSTPTFQQPLSDFYPRPASAEIWPYATSAPLPPIPPDVGLNLLDREWTPGGDNARITYAV